MGHDVTITLRLPAKLVDRVEQLIPFIQAQPLNSTTVNRSTALRYALLRGIEEVEEDHDMRRHLELKIKKQLQAGASVVDIAVEYKKNGIKIRDIERIEKKLSHKQIKSQKKIND